MSDVIEKLAREAAVDMLTAGGLTDEEARDALAEEEAEAWFEFGRAVIGFHTFLRLLNLTPDLASALAEGRAEVRMKDKPEFDVIWRYPMGWAPPNDIEEFPARLLVAGKGKATVYCPTMRHMRGEYFDVPLDQLVAASQTKESET